MKTKIAILLFSMLAFMACEEDLTVDLDANFYADIEAESVEQPVEGLLMKAASMNKFSGETMLKLEDDEDVKPYIDRIKSVKISGIRCDLMGIPVGEAINELTIEFEGTQVKQVFTNITKDNNSFDFVIDNALLDEAGSYLSTNKQMKIKAYGSTSTAPMTLRVKLKFISKVKAKVL
jgi:hypothetical protein